MASRTGYCPECGKETEIVIQKIITKQKIKEREYTVRVLTAHCKECGEEINIPGFLEQNLKNEDQGIRNDDDLVSIQEINQLMELYNIGKAPLSLALGFGEITIPRYLDGQIPSKAYSEIIRHALTSYDYMERLLTRNQDKLAQTAYEKAANAIKEYKRNFKVSTELLQIVSFLFHVSNDLSMKEIHCLLYYMQGFYLAITGKMLFPEEPDATSSGPEYRLLTNLLSTYHYDIKNDPKFSFIEHQYLSMDEETEAFCHFILNGLGAYNGSILSKCIKREKPYQNAREGLDDSDECRFTISKEDMLRYFTWVSGKFGIHQGKDLKRYLQYLLNVELLNTGR